MKPAELREAALVQFEGFYEPVPAAGPLNILFRLNFRGQVISALQEKMRYKVDERWVPILA